MKRHSMFIATALVVAGLAATGVTAAQTTAPERGQRVQLDVDKDGAISREEAAKSPRLAARFAELDKDGDGKLTAAERPRHHGKRGDRDGGHHGGRRAGGIERLDTDGDGRISRAEFDKGQTAKAARDAARPARGEGKGPGIGRGMALDFAAVDANKDGYVVRSELRAWHERQRPQREAEMAKRFDARFAEADLNGDGKLSRVEVDEKMPRLGKRFAWMDDNRDGFLSKDELKPARNR